jgi:hypothetical protein
MPAEPFTTPPIPVHLAQFPTIGGLVVPFITLQHRDGAAALGLVDSTRLERCLRERRCSVCGQVIVGRTVFLMRSFDLARKSSVEPGLCPPCAAYTQQACPMVAGYMEHYRKSVAPLVKRRCGDPACLCWAWVSPSEPSARLGAPAERWYALWTMQYQLTRDSEGRLVAGFAGLQVLAIRELNQRLAGK